MWCTSKAGTKSQDCWRWPGPTSAAASKQLEAIELLQRSGRLEALPPALRDVAELRLQYPYLNLSELAEAGGEGLTRSAVNHRLRRLVQAAERKGAKRAYASMPSGHGTKSRQ